MIGKTCRHRKYGYIGVITKELKGTNKYPDQWGVHWYGSDHMKKSGYNYWNDKGMIEIIEN